MINKKYQVFVSSTYEDLKEARQTVIRSILEMGHIPVGMEMFSAGDEEQWQIISRTIADCDYYVVIVAHRYGSEKDGKSYTQLEYELAEELKIPRIGLVIDSKAQWSAEFFDTEKEKVEKLNAFKNSVKSKMVGFWKSPDDLDSKFIKAIHKEFNLHSRTGWIRASELPSNELSNELLRLTNENKKLTETLNEINPLLNENHNKTDEIIQLLTNYHVDLEVRFEGTPSKWEVVRKLCLWDVFQQIMLNIEPERNSTHYLNNTIAFVFTPKESYTKKKFSLLKNGNRIPSNTFNEWLQLIESLGLIKNEYADDLPTDKWRITEFGRNLFLYQCRKDLKNGVDV